MKIFDAGYIWTFLKGVLPYLPVTIKIWLASVLLAVIFGSFAAAVRVKNIPVLNQIIRVFISYVRGTPIIAQLFLVYFGVRSWLKVIGIVIPPEYGMIFVVITYGLNMGAAVSENLRSAFLSVGKGQIEAAYTIGMTSRQAFFRIILSQAMVVALPNFANILVASLKNTSLAFSVGVVEMMKSGQNLAAVKQHHLEAYIALSIIYYILYLIIIYIFRIVDKKLIAKNAVKRGVKSEA